MVVQIIVYVFRQLAADPANPDQVIDARVDDALQTAELSQQLPAPFGSETGNVFEARCATCLCASRPMPGNREAMRLVANLLDQVQGGGIRR